MNISPEKLREIALRLADTVFAKESSLLDYATALFAEFQKLQAEQEPVAWILPTQPPRIVDHMNFNANYGGTVTSLYAAPPDLAAKVAELTAENKLLREALADDLLKKLDDKLEWRNP